MGGLLAFLMSRICERGIRNFGRESRRGELYAAAVLGVLLLLLIVSAALVLNGLLPGWLDLKSPVFSKLGLLSLWIVATLVTYALLVPHGRYRTWAEDFKARYELARERPGLMEILAIASVFVLLIVGIGLNWLRSVLSGTT